MHGAHLDARVGPAVALCPAQAGASTGAQSYHGSHWPARQRHAAAAAAALAGRFRSELTSVGASGLAPCSLEAEGRISIFLLYNLVYQMLRELLACTPETCGCCYCSMLAECADISGGPLQPWSLGDTNGLQQMCGVNSRKMEDACMCTLAHVSHDLGRRRHMQAVSQS